MLNIESVIFSSFTKFTDQCKTNYRNLWGNWRKKWKTQVPLIIFGTLGVTAPRSVCVSNERWNTFKIGSYVVFFFKRWIREVRTIWNWELRIVRLIVVETRVRTEQEGEKKEMRKDSTCWTSRQDWWDKFSQDWWVWTRGDKHLAMKQKTGEFCYS
jgi:hypothetical protein